MTSMLLYVKLQLNNLNNNFNKIFKHKSYPFLELRVVTLFGIPIYALIPLLTL